MPCRMVHELRKNLVGLLDLLAKNVYFARVT